MSRFPLFCFALSLILCAAVNFSLLAERDPIRLTHGPMLGRPAADSMLVWGRTSDPGEFTVRYGLDPDHLDQVSPPAVTEI